MPNACSDDDDHDEPMIINGKEHILKITLLHDNIVYYKWIINCSMCRVKTVKSPHYRAALNKKINWKRIFYSDIYVHQTMCSGQKSFVTQVVDNPSVQV